VRRDDETVTRLVSEEAECGCATDRREAHDRRPSGLDPDPDEPR